MSTININVSKTDMGLDQVDNTSDLNKPISTATQTALDNIDLQSVTDSGNTTTDNIAFTGAVGVLFDNTSTLRKGTIDAGYGGAKGIAQVCAVGYELKWEAGRLYIMGDGGTTIREVSHNFTTTPSATDDNTKGFIVGSRWILDNGDLYVCTDVTTATAVWVLQTIDASPTDGSTKAVSSNGVFDALALKQDTLSGGTTNRLTKWSSSSAISNSLIQDNGTTLSIGTTPVANNLVKVSSNATDTTLVSENSQASGVGISGSSSGSNGIGGSFTSTSVTGVKIGVNASATGAGGTNKGAVFGATNGATNYSIQLTDGTEGSGKFLKSVTANGEANWASIANTDVSGLGTLATATTIPTVIQLACSDETTALTTGTSKVTFRMPHAMTLTAVRASLNVAGTTSGITTIDINEGGTSILSTKLTIDLTEKTSTTALTPAVMSDSSLADDAEITIDIDAISVGATEKGLKITLIGTRAV